MENKNDEVYKLYGEFLIKFEYVCHLMRFGILYQLFPNYTEKQLRKVEIITENITADQLRNKFKCLIMEEFEKDSETFKLSNTISEIFEKLIPLRNSFAHGTSFIGKNELQQDAEDGLLLLRHPKLKKTGLDLNFKKYDIDTLKQAIKIFEKLYIAISRISILSLHKEAPKDYEPRFLEVTRLELRKFYEKFENRLKK